VSVERFLNVVRQQLHIDAAYLYGSQVAGLAKPWSDIDVAVVSSDFSEDLFEDRLILMAYSYAYRIIVVCLACHHESLAVWAKFMVFWRGETFQRSRWLNEPHFSHIVNDLPTILLAGN